MRENIETRAGRLLRSGKLTLALAESCTGGLAGYMVTAVPGSSAWFPGGVVAYCNRLKTKLLGVRRATLVRYGAVSAEIAREMAAGARRVLGANIGLSITGIAGPGGGSVRKPVGLVFLGLSDGRYAMSERRVFDGSRNTIREQAARAALGMLTDHLESLSAASGPAVRPPVPRRVKAGRSKAAETRERRGRGAGSCSLRE